MGSTYTVTASVEDLGTLPQSPHTSGSIAQDYENPKNPGPSKLNLYARLKKFATVAVTRLGLKQTRTDAKEVSKGPQAPLPLSQSFPPVEAPPDPPVEVPPDPPDPPVEVPPEDPEDPDPPDDPKPRISELEQLYLDMNIVTRVNKPKLGLLLRAFARYVVKLCAGMYIKPTTPEVAKWVIAIDKSLQDSKWTKITFVCESHLVFLFMLMGIYSREKTFLTIRDVRETLHVCLYVSYTYIGNEISYPARPFLSLGQDRNKFFQETVSLCCSASGDMLEINQDQEVYRLLRYRLLSYAYGPRGTGDRGQAISLGTIV